MVNILLSRGRMVDKISKDWLYKYKSTLQCSACPENDTICLSFHHLDPDNKVASIYELLNKGATITELQTEIAKCIVLCMNCHLKLHRDKRDTIKFNDFNELSPIFVGDRSPSLWSQDDNGNEGLCD